MSQHVGLKLISAAGLYFLFLGIVYNEFTASLLDPDPPLASLVLDSVRSAQVTFLAIGMIFLLFAGLSKNQANIAGLLNRDLPTNLILTFLVLFIPVATIEIGGRPWLAKNSKTTVFVRDPELGWKLRAGAKDSWGGVVVQINSKGLRGPEVPYKRDPLTRRILFLGDSVTFGYMLQYPDSFPHQVGSQLESRLGTTVESVNAGVGGYATWQELKYLKSEGMRYEPDLVVLTFVLNDFHLGGGNRDPAQSQGYQLRNTALSTLDLYSKKSVLLTAAIKLGARNRFGRNVQEGARKAEVRSIREFARDPDAPWSASVWDTTLSDLRELFEFCQGRDTPILLVLSPFRFQFGDPEQIGGPQERLQALAAEMNVPTVDLLPFFKQIMIERDLDPTYFFFDENHLSEQGSQVVSQILTDIILSDGLLDLSAKGTREKS